MTAVQPTTSIQPLCPTPIGIRGVARRIPIAIAVTALVTFLGSLTWGQSSTAHAHLMNRIGTDWDVLRAGHLWVVPLATWFQSSPGIEWHMILLVFVPLAMLELQIGSARALVTFLASDWIASPLSLLPIWIAARLGSDAAVLALHTLDSGSSAAAHGALSAALMMLPGRWPLVAMPPLIAFTIASFTFQSIGAATAHLLGASIGALLAWFFWRPHCQRSPAMCGPLTAENQSSS